MQAFRPGAVDLPTESAVAPLATITLPETFGEYDITMPTDEIECVLSFVSVVLSFSVSAPPPNRSMAHHCPCACETPNRLPSEEDLLSANRVAHRISITLHQ